MDFTVAEDFLDHLEMHPNGSFVLVKRDDLPQPTPESPEPIVSEKPTSTSPTLPEMLIDPIKVFLNHNLKRNLRSEIILLQIEPISDDDSIKDEYNEYKISEPVLLETTDANLNSSLSAMETTDPNHQLMVLSNPRIGDGPGEYLCNVCNAKFVYKNNLKSHLKRHLGIYPYVCFCGKRYQFKCKLNKHIEQVNENTLCLRKWLMSY